MDDLAALLRQSQRLVGARRDQVRTLEDRINRAIAALDACADAPSDKATRSESATWKAANNAAWIILTEGRDPHSRRNA